MDLFCCGFWICLVFVFSGCLSWWGGLADFGFGGLLLACCFDLYWTTAVIDMFLLIEFLLVAFAVDLVGVFRFKIVVLVLCLSLAFGFCDCLDCFNLLSCYFVF